MAAGFKNASELRRNAATRGGKLDCRASVAQWKAELLARRPKTAKLVANQRLRDYVQDLLAGAVRTRTRRWSPVRQPQRGRAGKPRRQYRRWANSWSPEQIANRLRVEFPDDESVRISHEAIYQALYVESRGRSSANWSPACAPAGRCGSREPALDNAPVVMSHAR